MWLPPGFAALRPKALGGIIGSCRAFGTALHRFAASSNPSLSSAALAEEDLATIFSFFTLSLLDFPEI